MSLINDALKKAQRQQTGGAAEPAPSVTPTGAPAARVERREKPADFRSQVLVLGGVSAGLLLALIVGGFFWWRSSHPSEPAAPQTVAQTTAPAAKPVEAAPAKPEPKPEPVKVEPTPVAPAATTAATTPASTGTPQFTLPLAPQTSTPPASTSTSVATTANPTPAVQLPSNTPPADAVKLPPAERPKATAQMVKMIESYRVKSIRAAGDDSKVLMNDRVYRIGDTVDFDLGIKLTGVVQGALTFENAQGAVYTRNF